MKHVMLHELYNRYLQQKARGLIGLVYTCSRVKVRSVHAVSHPATRGNDSGERVDKKLLRHTFSTCIPHISTPRLQNA